MTSSIETYYYLYLGEDSLSLIAYCKGCDSDVLPHLTMKLRKELEFEADSAKEMSLFEMDLDSLSSDLD